MNSRWPEYDYYYHLNTIHIEVAKNQQIEKAKQAKKLLKIPSWNLRSWLVSTLGRLYEEILA